MPTIETNLGAIFARLPVWRVSVSNKLTEGFNEVPYLRVAYLRDTAGPDVDVCHLQYDFGPIMREDKTTVDVYAPQDLQHQFVKVEMIQRDENGDPDEMSQYNWTWYGYITQDEKEADGSFSDVAQGSQLVYAFGLIHLLERDQIRKGRIENDLRIDRGLIFNEHPRGDFPILKNRAKTKDGTDPLGGDNFLFAADPRKEGEMWTGADIVRHILTYHSPKDKDDTSPFPWVLDDPDDILAWPAPVIPTDLMTPKQVIDRVIDRRRGLGYRTEFDAVNVYVKIIPFTATDTAVNLPSGATLPANPDTYDLNFEKSNDVRRPVIRDVASNLYTKIRAVGEFETSTFTLLFAQSPPSGNPHVVKGWTVTQESNYLGHILLDDDEIQAILERMTDESAPVFHRWYLNPSWDGIYNGQQILSPQTDPDTGEISDVEAEMHPLFFPGARFLDRLPLYDAVDYSGDNIENGLAVPGAGDETDYLRPFFFVTETGDGPFDGMPLLLDKLSETAGHEEDNRKWSVRSKLLETGPGFELSVAGGPQYFLAAGQVASLSAPETHDPIVNKAIDWDQIFGTVSIQLDRRLTAEEIISESELGEMERVKTIYVPGKRRDWVAPGTTTRIVIDTGVPEFIKAETTNGGAVRDDLQELRDVAKAAAEWYGKERRTLAMDIRNLARLIQPGWLITDIGAAYNKTGINTVVTAVEYYPLAPTPHQTLETDYYELDFRS